MFRPLGSQKPKGPTTRIVVDGETFDIEESAERPGQFHFDWTSGPNPGYGFSMGTSGGRGAHNAEIEATIRDFLAGIDPETGYLSE